MARLLGAVMLLWAGVGPAVARAEEPPRHDAGARSHDSSPTAADVAAEERAFSAELESYARRRAFTEQLMAKREAEAFELAILRQTRAENLKRELEARRREAAEREVEEAVALYLRKRELTRTLAAPRGAPTCESAVVPPAGR